MKDEDMKKGLQKASSSSYSQNSQVWAKLLGLNIKQKIKHFIWKCLNQSLPVHELIFKRTRIGDPRCKQCGENIETIEHMLFFSKQADATWRMALLQWEGLRNLRNQFWRWREEFKMLIYELKD
ncbi:hypothetical protein ACH5RR_017635 [Cinchona calisaya]|uniref:Reverse transcriptase zinc-binding domain-containing protein n=1 Tax=Cinchona calisaya TaxID=153742 RepID=A0ABD2ZJ40_9GENT